MSLEFRRSSGMQQTVRLLGDLGERYGAEHEYYNLKSPAEAIKLLCINKPEFMQELCEAHEHGIGYRVIQAGTDLDYPDLELPLGSHDLIVTPVVTGSGGGGGVGRILAGVGLIAASFLLPGAGLFGATSLFGASAVAGGIGTALGTAFSAIGASLILGGVAQLISPVPATPQGADTQQDPRKSFSFSGVQNTSRGGTPVPIVYGKTLTGSVVISAGIDTVQVRT